VRDSGPFDDSVAPDPPERGQERQTSVEWTLREKPAMRTNDRGSLPASRKGPAARSSGVCLPLTCCRRGNNGRYGVVS
jgi:hypothetical protein